MLMSSCNYRARGRHYTSRMLILGIESSCDETGVALVATADAPSRVPLLLSHALYSQIEMHQAYGGVVPELASRDHIRRVLPLTDEVMQASGCDLQAVDVVAYTRGPGLAGALLVGAGVACALAAWGLSPLLDSLALGESTALSLGLRVVPGRMALVAVLALATATSVAQTGLIAFVGLAAPHLVRARVSVGHARFVGLSMLAGGVLLCAADVLARGLLAPRELPVGVVTAIVGGIYLLRLMRQPLHARHS